MFGGPGLVIHGPFDCWHVKCSVPIPQAESWFAQFHFQLFDLWPWGYCLLLTHLLSSCRSLWLTLLISQVGGKSTSNIWNVCLGFLVLIFHVGVLVCAEMFPVYSSRPSGAVNLHLSLRDVSAVRRDWVSRWWSVNDKCNCPATSFSPLDDITHLLAVWTVIAIGRGLESTVYSPKHKIIVEFVTSYLDHKVKLKCWGKVNCRIVYVLKNQIAC